MEYMILIYGDESAWPNLGEAQLKAIVLPMSSRAAKARASWRASSGAWAAISTLPKIACRMPTSARSMPGPRWAFRSTPPPGSRPSQSAAR